MPPEDTMTRRLEALRRRDRTGFYASDRSAIGRDSTGALTVTVDPTNRITQVAVTGSADRLREPGLLAAAVDEAAGAARAARLAASRPDDPARGDGTGVPVAQRAKRYVHEVENFQETGRVPSGALRGSSARFAWHALSPAAGSSHNACVTVTLDLASAHGRIDVDRGWLANARPAGIGSAITEAYADAYRKQDRA